MCINHKWYINLNPMNFKLLTQKIAKCFFDYSQRHNIEITPEFAAIKLTEEVGEFNQALLIHQKKCRESKYLDPKISSLCHQRYQQL